MDTSFVNVMMVFIKTKGLLWHQRDVTHLINALLMQNVIVCLVSANVKRTTMRMKTDNVTS